MTGTTTIALAASGGDQLFGWCGCVVAVVFFGTNFVPVKKVDPGDGIFFGWCMALGVWLTGLIADHTPLATAGHQFEPACMIGGCLWAMGNVAGPLIIKNLGMGLAVTTWGLTSLIMGWATGTFGFFGVKATPASNPALNYVGVAIAVFAGICFGLIQPEHHDDEKSQPLMEVAAPVEPPESKIYRQGSTGQFGHFHSHEEVPHEASHGAYYLSFLGAAIAGVCIGMTFDEMTVMLQGAPANGHSTNAFDYTFSTVSGIFASYSLVFVVYGAIMREKAHISKDIVVPALICGSMWMVAFLSWSCANARLSMSIAFPIISTGPSIVSLSVGVFVFGEYKEKRNLQLIVAASIIAIIGVTIISQSK